MGSVKIWTNPLLYLSLLSEITVEYIVGSAKFCIRNGLWILLALAVFYGPRYVEGSMTQVDFI
jgi:hypothetical protein